MMPVEFEQCNFTFSKPASMTDEECLPLQVFKGNDTLGSPVIISCWQLTKEDLEEINTTGRVFLTICGNGMPPVSLQTENPFNPSNVNTQSMKQLIELQEEIHENAVKKGFWEEPVNIAEKLMLVVTEVAEMCEAHRKGIRCNVIPHTHGSDDGFKAYFQEHVKDTFEDEMADAIIRLLDMAKKLDIPLEEHVEAKMRYNSLRPYKHGKAY